MEAFEAERIEVLWHVVKAQSGPETLKSPVWNFHPNIFQYKYIDNKPPAEC